MEKLFVFTLLLMLLVPECLGAETQPNKIKASLLREDVDFLVRTIEEIHPDSYTKVSREEFYRAKDKVKSEIRDMDVYQFYNLIAPLVAMIGDAHTAVYPLRSPGKCFPVPVAVLDEGIFVARNYTNISAGREILSINGVDSGRLVDAMLRFVPCERREFGLAQVESNFPFYLYLVLGEIDPFTVTFGSDDGTENREIKASSPQSYIYPYQGYERYLRGSGNALPLGNYPYIFTLMNNKTTLLVINSFREGPYMPWGVFLSGIFSYLKENGIENLVIDIRANGGGASSMGDELIDYLTNKPWTQFGSSRVKYSEQAIAQWQQSGWYRTRKAGTIESYTGGLEKPSNNSLRFNGSVYLLTSRFTFSSASSFAAAIKDFNIGTVVGEETGGIFPNFGDVIIFELPNSKIKGQCSHKEWHRWNDTDPGRGVKPDYEVKPVPEDLASGRDSALDLTMKLIAGL
jgi:hypothetical protein